MPPLGAVRKYFLIRAREDFWRRLPLELLACTSTLNHPLISTYRMLMEALCNHSWESARTRWNEPPRSVASASSSMADLIILREGGFGAAG